MTTSQEDQLQAIAAALKSPQHLINIRSYGRDSLELQPLQGFHIDGPRKLHFCKPDKTLEEIADVAAYCLDKGIRYMVEGTTARDFVRSHLIPVTNA
jgi:hypothetical protein